MEFRNLMLGSARVPRQRVVARTLHALLAALGAIEMALGGLVTVFPRTPQWLGIIMFALGLVTLAVAIEAIWRSLAPTVLARHVNVVRTVLGGIGLLLVAAVFVAYLSHTHVEIGAQTAIKNGDGTFTVSQSIRVDPSHEIDRLYVIVKSEGIISLDVKCQTNVHGHPIKSNHSTMLTYIKNPSGEYCIIATSKANTLKITTVIAHPPLDGRA